LLSGWTLNNKNFHYLSFTEHTKKSFTQSNMFNVDFIIYH